HAALRPFLDLAEAEAAEFEKTGYISWGGDLAAIPNRHGVKNGYAENGTAFASTVITNQRLAAGMLGTFIEGEGVVHVIGGRDSGWYGSRQWQIEARRGLEIPKDLQTKHGFALLGPADGAVKNAIFWDNGAKFYRLPKRADYDTPIQRDALDKMKDEYKK